MYGVIVIVWCGRGGATVATAITEAVVKLITVHGGEESGTGYNAIEQRSIMV